MYDERTYSKDCLIGLLVDLSVCNQDEEVMAFLRKIQLSTFCIEVV